MNELKVLSYNLGKHAVDMIIVGEDERIGGDMGVMEIPVELYMKQMNISPENKELDNHDRFMFNRDHSVESYYAALAKKEFFPVEKVISILSQSGSKFVGHPNNKLLGIEVSSGSLGHSLPVCVGMTMAGKMGRKDYRAYTITGDGELAEGSVWEGAMAASRYCLDSLCIVVNRGRLRTSGCTEGVMDHGDLHERLRSFGWHVTDVADGNDIDQPDATFEETKTVRGKPIALITSTVKGCGSSVMENKAAWHHKIPAAQEYSEIIRDLGKRKKALSHE